MADPVYRLSYPRPVLTPRTDGRGPVLLIALAGHYNRAKVAERIAGLCVFGLDHQPAAEFDPEQLYTYGLPEGRPEALLGEEGAPIINWPLLELSKFTDLAGTEFFILYGEEPTLRWPSLLTAVGELVQAYGMSHIYGMASFGADVPHTRPLLTTITGSDRSQSQEVERFIGKETVPASFLLAVEEAAVGWGIPTTTVSVRVPNYIAGGDYVRPAVVIGDRLEQLTGLQLPLDTLRSEIEGSEAALTEAMSEHEALQAVLARVEERYDEHLESFSLVGPHDMMPTSEQLGEEFERYLQEQAHKDQQPPSVRPTPRDTADATPPQPEADEDTSDPHTAQDDEEPEQ